MSWLMYVFWGIFLFIKFPYAYEIYRKVASFKYHVSFRSTCRPFQIAYLREGILDPYLLRPFDKKKNSN